VCQKTYAVALLVIMVVIFITFSLPGGSFLPQIRTSILSVKQQIIKVSKLVFIVPHGFIFSMSFCSLYNTVASSESMTGIDRRSNFDGQTIEIRHDAKLVRPAHVS
jgi:hypothetical protein